MGALCAREVSQEQNLPIELFLMLASASSKLVTHTLLGNTRYPGICRCCGSDNGWGKIVMFLLTGFFIQFNSKGILDVCSRWYPGQAAFSKESSWILADEVFCIIWWSYFISDFWTGQMVHLDLILPHFIDGLSQIVHVCANWPWRSSLLLNFYDIASKLLANYAA